MNGNYSYHYTRNSLVNRKKPRRFASRCYGRGEGNGDQQLCQPCEWDQARQFNHLSVEKVRTIGIHIYRRLPNTLLALISTQHCTGYSSQAVTEIISASAATWVAEYSARKKTQPKKPPVFTTNNVSCSTVSSFQLELFGSELMKALWEYRLEGGQHPDVFDRSKNLCKPHVSCLKVTPPE